MRWRTPHPADLLAANEAHATRIADAIIANQPVPDTLIDDLESHDFAQSIRELAEASKRISQVAQIAVDCLVDMARQGNVQAAYAVARIRKELES